MHGDPFGKSDTHGTHFFIPNPDACHSRDSTTLDLIRLKSLYDHLFQIPHVPADTFLMVFQIDDGISDKLAGTMPGNIPASITLNHLCIPGINQVGSVRIFSKGVNRRVFQKDEGISPFTCQPAGVDLPLVFPGFFIGNQTLFYDSQIAHIQSLTLL